MSQIAERTCVYTVAQIHQWMIDQEPKMQSILARQTHVSSRLQQDFSCSPDVQNLRRKWKSHRPFPSAAQFVLLFGLFSPGQRMLHCDPDGYDAALTALAIMGRSDGYAERVEVDLARGRAVVSGNGIDRQRLVDAVVSLGYTASVEASTSGNRKDVDEHEDTAQH